MPNRRISESVTANALENVKFYADSTWGSSEFQKANQVTIYYIYFLYSLFI